MSGQQYAASKSPTKDRTAWVMSFRHPLRKDPRGKQGRKVRRGLSTSDEARAQALVDQMNELLGDATWHSIAKRAEAERRFDPIVIRAFYDDIETPPSNSWDIRNEALPLPTVEDGYAQVMMVGTTGAGKTSLLRHIIGSHPERDRFPSTSASRTTISDIEVIMSGDPPSAKYLTRKVDELPLSIRTANCLRDNKVVYISDLVGQSEDTLLRTPNFGRKSLNEIKEELAKIGLRLGMQISQNVISPISPYRAVVTFFNEWTVHTNVHECVGDACAALWEELTDDKLAERLLTHRDLRFRLGYIIGSWKQTTASASDADNDWDYEKHERGPDETADESDGALPTTADLERMHASLRSYLDRVRALAAEAKQRLQADLDVDLDALAGSDKEAAQDLFEDIVQSLSDFDDLVNDIMDEIRRRFDGLTTGTLRSHPNGWPQSWHYETADRTDFVHAVRRFSSNYARAFGTLLTPLVDGIRIQGRFFPAFADRRPRLVLLDGEGLGHVGDPAAGVASRIARRFGDVDVILLVDSAKAPMLEAPASVLRAVAASGYQKKLAIAFTHFDLVRGQANLPTFEAQRAHVLSSVHQKLASLREIVGQPAVRAIERELDERCFMLGFLDRDLTEKNRGPVREILRLIDFCEAAIEPEELPEVRAVYDTAGLVLAIQAATTDFHRRWNTILGFRRSGDIRTAHWAEIKALNRRVVLDINSGEYKDLKPVADFVARLSESITKFLDRPIRWKPRIPTDAEADGALSRVQREVFARLHKFVEGKLLRVPRQQWMKAFEYRGRGSTFDRAKVIQTIYEASAPIPGPALDPHSEQFLREVRLLVHEAIREGGGELVSDVLGQSTHADVQERSAAS